MRTSACVTSVAVTTVPPRIKVPIAAPSNNPADEPPAVRSFAEKRRNFLGSGELRRRADRGPQRRPARTDDLRAQSLGIHFGALEVGCRDDAAAEKVDFLGLEFRIAQPRSNDPHQAEDDVVEGV